MSADRGPVTKQTCNGKDGHHAGVQLYIGNWPETSGR